MNLSKRLIRSAGDIIEERYWKGVNIEGTEAWKVGIEIILVINDFELAKHISVMADMQTW